MSLALADDAGDADFRGGNHINVDAAVGQDAEHPGGVARRVLHPGADDAHRGQRGVVDYLICAQGVPKAGHLPQGAGQVVGGDGKADVGSGAVGAGVLDDGVHADAGGRQRLKQSGGHAGLVRNAADGNFGDVGLVGDAGYFDAVFHLLAIRLTVIR